MLVQFCIDRPFDMKYFAASAALVGIFESCDRVIQEHSQRWPGQLRYFRADANIICILGRCEYNGCIHTLGRISTADFPHAKPRRTRRTRRKNFSWLFRAFAWGNFFGNGIQTTSRSLRLRVTQVLFMQPHPLAHRRKTKPGSDANAGARKSGT